MGGTRSYAMGKRSRAVAVVVLLAGPTASGKSRRALDIAARREAGRRYLTGGQGFPRHLATGIDYLSRPSVADHPDAARIISECLTLEELGSWQQEQVLPRDAAAGVAVARTKHGRC